ncbi:MAG: hypothetical protein GF400_05990 [Candidatus Eisenbacteria bacterium]|nr:hypothetical protein [Candidatus Eisenbacteria bacterium]
MTSDFRAVPVADIQVLNRLLASGLSLSVVTEPGRGEAPAEIPPPETEPRRARARVVLVQSDERGSRREASRRLLLTCGRRRLLLGLSECLAECAMDLGLGASVCRPRVESP